LRWKVTTALVGILVAGALLGIAFGQYQNCAIDPKANQIICPGIYKPGRRLDTNYLTTGREDDILTTNTGDPLVAR
jgi:hypothetical protein